MTWYCYDIILLINNKVITDKNSPFSVFNAFILSLLKLCHHVMHVFTKGISNQEWITRYQSAKIRQFYLFESKHVFDGEWSKHMCARLVSLRSKHRLTSKHWYVVLFGVLLLRVCFPRRSRLRICKHYFTLSWISC